MAKKILKTFVIFYICLFKTNIFDFLRYYNSKSKNIIYLSSIKGSFSNEVFVWEMSAINFFLKNKKDFKIKFNLDGIKDSNIIWSPSEAIFRKKFKEYSTSIIKIAREAESNGNRILPCSSEMLFWENKSFMYKSFEEKDILHPKTLILEASKEIPESLNYPILLKGEFSSGSKDIFKIDSKKHLIEKIEKERFSMKFNNLILQKLLNIRKDLRVTIVDKEVVLFYWRINPSKDWKPTASSYGSSISFDDYPYKWNSYFFEVMDKLDLKMAAFDFAWEDDNLDFKPYLLEVSPRFSPNPVFNHKDLTYGEWKKKLFSKNSYAKLQTDLIYKINQLYLERFFKKNKT